MAQQVMQITQTLANELKTQALSGQVDKIGMKTDMIIRIVTKQFIQCFSNSG